MAKDEPPRLKVVAERCTEEVERERALDELRWPLIDFAANLLRVIRGAGRSHELREQSFALSDALEKVGKRTGRWPSHKPSLRSERTGDVIPAAVLVRAAVARSNGVAIGCAFA